ncbi:MAG: RagB/SusD family nutrient uptake outer membrane protein, partial [Tannerella sp.]|nr:RagB/SusD family nutrient uptake outer membrane protein [Tannerella sp.]
FYIARAAETLLLRAEAKLRKGDATGAAADINEVRERAHAPLVTPGDVTIDYILDERVRELYAEENRWQTLLRMGGDIARNRIMKYAVNFADYPAKKSGEPWTDFLWPIPQSTIDSNIDAILEQNPGW